MLEGILHSQLFFCFQRKQFKLICVEVENIETSVLFLIVPFFNYVMYNNNWKSLDFCDIFCCYKY